MKFGHAFYCQVRREWYSALRQPRLLVHALLFFIMIVLFFPLTLPPHVNFLRQTAPGLIWIASLLALLLASERLFQTDYEEGVIEQWLVNGAPLEILIAAKISLFWLLTLVPLLSFCPFLALLFQFSWYETQVLITSLILGTPALFALCALAAVFGTGLQQRGVFMALILLPLSIPVMIFGSGTLHSAMLNEPIRGYLAILAAFSLLTMSFLPWAIAAIMRISLSD